MKYCPRCLMPTTHPNLLFNKDGVCQACINYDNNGKIDWEYRWKIVLKDLCTKIKEINKPILIGVSGGKDSTYITYIMKELMEMDIVLFTVNDPFTTTDAGIHNLNNLRETFNCDSYVFEMGKQTFRKATRYAFENFGEPLRLIEQAIYATTLRFATYMKFPLVVFGENSSYIYGSSDKDVMYANKYIESMFKNIDYTSWKKAGIPESDLSFVTPPKEEYPPVIFMSYFSLWDNAKHVEIAKKHGFKTVHHEWDRQGTVEVNSQIDSLGYLVQLYTKYPKFGAGRTTDICSREIRAGRLSIEEGKELILKHDHVFDERSVEDFCQFCGYTAQEFWKIVDSWYNRDLFEKNKFGQWVLKEPRF